MVLRVREKIPVRRIDSSLVTTLSLPPKDPTDDEDEDEDDEEADEEEDEEPAVIREPDEC